MSDAVAATSAEREPEPPSPRRAYIVTAPEAARLPAHCARCDAAANHVRALGLGERTLLIPYCGECQRGLDARRTRDIALTLGSLLLGISASSTLLLIWEQLGFAAYVSITLGLAALPLFAGRWLPRQRAAVWWWDNQRLGCSSAPWAERFAQLNGSAVRREPWVHQDGLPAWSWTGVVLGAVAALWLFELHRPRLLVLNVSGQPFSVRLGESEAIRVPSTFAESASAGKRLRPPAGRHTVTILSETGDVLLHEVLTLAGDTDHLLAPLSQNHCFWLERVTYGRDREATRSLQPLSGQRRFWRLPDPVDIWFTPPPNEVTGDRRSSGGPLTALRQAPCDDAPAEVRRFRP